MTELYKTKAELKAAFTNFFEKEAAPLIKEYEASRKKDKPLVIALYLFFLSILFWWIYIPLGCILFFSSVVGLIFFGKNSSKSINLDYEMNLKTKLMPKFMSIFGNFRWSKTCYNKLAQYTSKLRCLHIFPKTFFIKYDDTIDGRYLDVNIEMLEILTGKYAWTFMSILIILIITLPLLGIILVFVIIGIVSIFVKNPNILGLIFLAVAFFVLIVFPVVFAILDSSLRCIAITCKFPKHFEGKTFLYENASTSKKLCLKNKNEFEEVKLEDVDFNKKYTIFSTNQIEARYILTTAFMERFKNIKTAFSANFIRAEFKDDELVILIGINKDMFSMGKITKQTTYLTFLELFEEMYSVLSITEQLKLNQKLGL